MSRMVEVVIDSVRVSLTNQQRIVVLRENNAERYLPIWIGPYEAEAITIALQEVEVARPQTHDLLKNVLKSLNARLSRVEILSLREDVFYGNLVVEVDGKVLDIDSRPSDAIALAVRWHVPILVAQEVLQTAGIMPEQELPEQPKPASEAPSTSEETESDERLSVFDDFLKNLGTDDPLDPPTDEDDSGKENPKSDEQ
ncbi:MAG: bifunctional nuclease family protein [Anaerolineaceae bacterium]|nr:bifunctional nuclease family protein [Anaerolineaceae bacterium]